MAAVRALGAMSLMLLTAGFCCLGKNAMSRTFFTVKVGDTRSQSKQRTLEPGKEGSRGFL